MNNNIMDTWRTKTQKYCYCLVLGLMLVLSITAADGYDPFDPNGNITIKWDVMSWTTDGYVALVSLLNYQQYRHIQSPGWSLRWTWAKKEVIWSMVGAQATEQGDCYRFKSSVPHCCQKRPTIVDLLPGVPYNQQIANCCKGGVISSYAQDPSRAVSAFQLSVGSAGTSRTTVRLPKNFSLMAPGFGYTCSPAMKVKPSHFPSPDGRRHTQALTAGYDSAHSILVAMLNAFQSNVPNDMTWNVICTYSQFLAERTPSCCVSFSSFYRDTIVSCPACSCGCHNNLTSSGACIERDSPHLTSLGVQTPTNNNISPLVQCTSHMCPIRIHWHVKLNYKEYWRVKITITNFNYMMNYSDWNIVAQHPNFNNLTQIFSFNYKPLDPYASVNDTALFWGIKYYNDMLLTAGPMGNVQSELLLMKNKQTFTLKQGWAFPRRIYFNGEDCVLPPPDAYPFLPNSSPASKYCGLVVLSLAITSVLVFL